MVGCALKSLFDQIFQNCDTVSINNDSVAESLGCFPSNLKSLSLIDRQHNNYNNSVTMSFTQPLRLNSYLTLLCVDVGSVDSIPMLVDCFSEAMAQLLLVLGCSLDSIISVRRDHAYIDHAITAHRHSLNRVRLIRAWQTDRRWIDELNDRSEGIYAIQELVLGTRNPHWYEGFIRQWRELIPKSTLSHYLCGFVYDTSGESGRRGTEIRRIRIDHVDIADLHVSARAEPFYSYLRILMLQPGSRGTCSNLPECEAIDKIIRVELAKSIIMHGASSLRVIIIGTHWYWVSKDGAGSEHNGVLWTCADAKGDSTQTELMFSTLNEAHLDFLEHSAVPWWQEGDSKEWHRNPSSNARIYPHQPSKEMLNQWNYLAPPKPATNKETPPTVPAKSGKLRAPATPDKSKNGKSGKKPRCKLPRSKPKLGKRVPEDDCEEWDDTAPAMKDNSGAPDVEKDNPGHFGVSGKWKYTDSKHPGAPMNAETLNILTEKQAKNQEAHWAQIKNEMKTQGTDPPWKDNEPPVNSFQARKEEGKDYWTLRGASNHVLMPGRNRDDNPPKRPNQLTALYNDTKAPWAYHQNNPLHAEEVNAAQREHEGKKPFEGTLNSAHETRVGEDNRPLPACGKSCAKQIKAGDGTDANPDAIPITPYQEKERAKQATRKRAKMAKMAPQGSDND